MGAAPNTPPVPPTPGSGPAKAIHVLNNGHPVRRFHNSGCRVLAEHPGQFGTVPAPPPGAIPCRICGG